MVEDNTALRLMWSLFRGGGLAALVVCLTGLSQPPAVHTDTISSRLTATEQVFHCGTARATLRYSEALDVDSSSVALADRWRIRDVSLSVADRVIAPAEQRRLGAWLHRFAWIERATMRCAQFNRDLQFNVEGMEAEAWAAFGEGRRSERPARTSLGFTVSATGALALN